MTVFDEGALRAGVEWSQARQESRERIAREGRRFGVALGAGWAVFQTVVLLVGTGILAALGVVSVQLLFGAHGADATTVVLAALMVAPLAVLRIRSQLRGPRDLEATEYRLTRFAAANGLEYRTGELDPERSAALFSTGSSRMASDIVAGPSPRVFEAANYSFDTWVARARMPRRTNYAAFDLRSPLPPLTLRTTSPAAAASGWELPATQEPLPVEGEIASHFEAFSSPATAEPVRHLLSPEVQAALIAIAGSCDIEVVGDRIYVIARRHLPMTAPAYWERIVDLAGLVTLLEARGRGEEVGEIAEADPARRARREALLAAPKVGRTAALGCLVPLLLGLTAAALITAITAGGW